MIKDNRNTFEKVGLLEDRRLGNIKSLNDATNLLRICYVNDPSMEKERKWNKFMSIFLKRVQRARYEDFVISLAVKHTRIMNLIYQHSWTSEG